MSGRNRYSAKVLDLLGLEGSNPSASAIFGSLAQLVERQFVGLVVAGSKPVKLPNMVGSSRWPRMTDFHSVHTS